MTSGTRISRFDPILSDPTLDAAVIVPAAPIALGRGTPEDDANCLRKALDQLYLPTAQDRSIIRHLLGMLRAHASCHFPTDEAYLEGFDRQQPWGKATSPAICLIGLSGTGKSSLLAALMRLLERSNSTVSVGGMTGIPLLAAWFATLSKGLGLTAVLEPIIRRCIEPPAASPNRDLPRARRTFTLKRINELAPFLTWRDGICLVSADESQFLSRSRDASTSAANLLCALNEIGPRFLFAINFSLGHKLKARRDEDTQRLMTHPILHRPDDMGPEWIALHREIQMLAPDVFTFDPERIAAETHKLTFGRRRALRDLIVLAYSYARLRKRGCVDIDEVNLAYKAMEFTVHRETAIELFECKALGKPLPDDLRCPFDEGRLQAIDERWGNAQDQSPSQTVVPATPAIDEFAKRVAAAGLAAAMTPAEAAGLKILQDPPAPVIPRAKVLRFRHKGATKEELLAGGEALASGKL